MKKHLLLALAVLLPLLCVAQPANDNCSGAITLPVNWGIQPVDYVTANYTGVTNGTATLCDNPGYNDLWYHFTALYTGHIINLENITPGLEAGLEVRNNSCSGTLNVCSMGGTEGLEHGWPVTCTPGQEYYVRVYTQGQVLPAGAGFTISVTSGLDRIVTNNTLYTTPDLVQEIFVSQPGLNITNISSTTGSGFNAAEPNGIAYFETNNYFFPYTNGIVLSTGNAMEAQGPNSTLLSSGTAAWPGDADLDNHMQPDYPGFESVNATVLEFDFVPDYTQMKFAFVYASEEYGLPGCSFNDKCAIILTDLQTDTEVNLAVVPLSLIPVNSVTVKHPEPGCPGQNPVWFSIFNAAGSGFTNYNGETNYFLAEAVVIPGGQYHLKIVVADGGSPDTDSALLLHGGSFNCGQPVYNGPYIVFDDIAPYSTCEEDTDGLTAFNLDWVEYIVDVVGEPDGYTFTCHASEADAQEGINPLPSGFTNTTPYEQTIYVRVSPLNNPVSFDIAPLVLKVYDMPVGTPGDYYVCDEDNDGNAVFNLTSQAETLYGPNAGDYFFSYYETEEGANAGGFTISNPGAYVNSSNPQTVYVRAESGMGACITYTMLTLHVLPAAPIDNLPAIALCSFTDTTDVTVNASAGLDTSLYTISYHFTEASAYDNVGPIPNPQSYSPQNEEGTVVWARIVNQLTGCVKVLPQELQLWEGLVNVTVDETGAAIWFTAGASGFEYTLALNGQPTTQTSFTIDDLNYCSNVLTVTNVTCNVTADFFFSIHPPAPTGPSAQAFTEGQTLADLDVTGIGISWFTAPLGGTYLPPDTPLQDGVTYYAAQLIDNCAGLDRLPVTVNLAAGLAGNELAALRCYPNPVKDELKLEHTTTLLGAKLYNTLGQEVLRARLNGTQATLNLSGLASGVYLMKVEAENGEPVIKVVKE